MTFRSIDHSSRVTLDVKLEDFPKELLTPQQAPQLIRYDDSKLEGAITRIQGEILALHHKINTLPKPEAPLPIVLPTFDYKWAEKQIQGLSADVHKIAFSKEMLESLFMDYFERFLKKIDEKPSPVIQLPEPLFDPSLRIAAIISSSSLLTITVLLVLLYIHQYN